MKPEVMKPMAALRNITLRPRNTECSTVGEAHRF